MPDLKPGVVLSPDTTAAMERLAQTNRSTMNENSYRATPEQWGDVEQMSAAWPSALLGPCILELRARVEALEAAQQQQLTPADDAPQTLHTIALGMVDSLGRSFNLLPEICDTLRRAIREPMGAAPRLAIKPPELIDSEATVLWMSAQYPESSANMTRRIHRAGWDAAMAAVAAQQRPAVAEESSAAQSPAPAPAGSLVALVEDAIVDGMVDSDEQAARAAIRAVAD